MTWDARACAVLVCALGACSGPGNTGKSSPPPELVAAVPWTNGAVPLHDSGGVVLPAEPIFPPIGLNTPDPGSGPVDCSALSEIELSPYWVETFEPSLTPDANVPNPVGIADAWSSNDDETKGSFRAPGDASWYAALVTPAKRYAERFGLAAERITGAPSCDGQPNEWAFHFRGGRFNYYGAAAEHPLQAYEIRSRRPEDPPLPDPEERCPAGSDFCPAEETEGALVDPVGLPLRYADGTHFLQQRHLYWDVSLYDGVTFWARRGPDGQPGMLFALQDKHTSDALNRQRDTFCRRIKTCRPVCQNGLPCSFDATEQTHRCFDPAVGLPRVVATELCFLTPEKRCIEPALREELYPLCGPSACGGLSHYADPDFDRIECKPYEFSGSQAGYYCYGDEPPPPDEERCGDAWVAPVRLSSDWTLYIIPFNEFRQVGFAKRAPFLDLHSIYSIALQFPVGYADVYVDNVSFYRRRR